MPFNGSGTFTRNYNWVNDKIAGTPITASRMDAEFDNYATGLGQTITKDGQTTLTGNIPFNNYKITGLGNGSARNDSIALGQVQDGSYTYLGTTTGSADAYTVAPAPTITAYATTQRFFAKIHATNTTTTPYLQISAIANPTTTAVIKKLSATKTEIALEASDLIANGLYEFQRNSANDAWIVLNPSKPKDLLATSTAQGISYLTTPVSWTNNTTDSNNDIDYTVGVIDHDDGSGQSLATTALTKQLDATFVAGNNQGGLDTGTKANSTWYQIFAITNNTTSAVDYLFSTSRTSPTIPSGWTRRRWLGAVRTNASGNIDQAYFARRTPFGQTVSFITGAYLSGVGQIPQDDTIPQNTEGYEFMSLPINPLSASSKLEVNSKGILYSSSSGSWRVAASLFRDSDLNAIGTDEVVGGGTAWGVILFPNATINSNSTNLTTFKFRAGSSISSTLYLNGYGGRYYGGSFSSYIKINEYL